MKSTFEKIGGTYTQGVDGIYYPNLVSTDEEPHYGKCGIMQENLHAYMIFLYSLIFFNHILHPVLFFLHWQSYPDKYLYFL